MSGERLIAAQNLSDLEQNPDKTQNIMRDKCHICHK